MCHTTIIITNGSSHDQEETRICDAKSKGKRCEGVTFSLLNEQVGRDSKDHKFRSKLAAEQGRPSTQNKNVPSTPAALPLKKSTGKIARKNSRAAKREHIDALEETKSDVVAQSAGEQKRNEWKMKHNEWKKDHAGAGRRGVSKQLKRKEGTGRKVLQIGAKLLEEEEY